MDNGQLKDYYAILGVPQTATTGEVHKAYWQKASRCHPDRGGSHEAMVQLVEAWKILSEPEKRARFDQLLKFRHDGWRNRKFDDDVRDARKRAEGYAASSWAEFEEIYQKAFYTFNQDFYGEDIKDKTAGPYSPLMGSGSKRGLDKGTLKSGQISGTAGAAIFAYILKTVILLVAVAAALFFFRIYSGVGRYEPLGQQDASRLLMLDTTSGAVYSVEKRGGMFYPWKKTVPPLPSEKELPRK